MTATPERVKPSPFLVSTDALGQPDLSGWERHLFNGGERLLMAAFAWTWVNERTIHLAVNLGIRASDWEVRLGRTLCLRNPRQAGAGRWLAWIPALPEGYRSLTEPPKEARFCQNCATMAYRLSRGIAANVKVFQEHPGTVPVRPVVWPADPRWVSADGNDDLSAEDETAISDDIEFDDTEDGEG